MVKIKYYSTIKVLTKLIEKLKILGEKYTLDDLRDKKLKENMSKDQNEDVELFKHYISKLEKNRELDKEREIERIKNKRLKQK